MCIPPYAASGGERMTSEVAILLCLRPCFSCALLHAQITDACNNTFSFYVCSSDQDPDHQTCTTSTLTIEASLQLARWSIVNMETIIDKKVLTGALVPLN